MPVVTEELKDVAPAPLPRPPYAGPNAVVGQSVLWFNKADRNTAPRAAVVTLSDGRGVLTVAVLHPNATIMDSKPGVRHLDDPWLKDHPDPADRNGAWDYVVDAKPPRQDLRTPRAKA